MSREPKRIGFFTRLLDEVPAAERYRLAAEQVRAAEAHGYHSAWIAQHHFDPGEGGLPAPFVFLAHVAAQTSRIRLGTGVVTLPLENTLRVAEDAAVLDALSGGRFEFGLGTGGTPATFAAFGVDLAGRAQVYAEALALLRRALRGEALAGPHPLYPAAPSLDGRIWQATFSVEGGRRAGLAGDGLLLSRTQPRPKGRPDLPLHEIQRPIVEAYLAALPSGHAPRILASRSVFVADSADEAARLAGIGLRNVIGRFKAQGHELIGESLPELLASFDTHAGNPEQVLGSLEADPVLAYATDVAVQVHSVDPLHAAILRSIELFATSVAPKLGWGQLAPAHA